MGMYTEIYVCCQLQDLDDNVVKTLKWMLSEGDKPDALPDHDLFKADRVASMLTCASYYFVPRSIHVFEHDKLNNNWMFICRSDFKNYDRETSKFFDWIMPYVDAASGEMIGYVRYEQDDEPTIIYKQLVVQSV